MARSTYLDPAAATAPAVTDMRARVRTLYLAVAWAFVVALAAQIFLAGLAVFAMFGGGAASFFSGFATHRDFGYLIGWFTVVLLVLAIVGRLPRATIGASALVLGLFALQSVFVLFKGSAPVIAALHPVNGVLIIVISVAIAVRARRYLVPARSTSAGETDAVAKQRP